MINEIAHYLSKNNYLTLKVFLDLWQYREEVPFIHKLRFTEQIPILQFLATQKINLLVDFLNFAYKKSPKYLEKIMNCWLEYAITSKNTQVIF